MAKMIHTPAKSKVQPEEFTVFTLSNKAFADYIASVIAKRFNTQTFVAVVGNGEFRYKIECDNTNRDEENREAIKWFAHGVFFVAKSFYGVE